MRRMGVLVVLMALACGGVPEPVVSAPPVFTRTGQLGEARFVFPEQVSGVALSPDDKRIAVTQIYQNPQVFDVATGKIAYPIDPKVGVTYAMSWSPDGTRLAVGGDAGLWLLDGATGKIIGGSETPTGGYLVIRWTRDGTAYAAGQPVVGGLVLADGKTGAVTWSGELDGTAVTDVDWSPDNKTVYLAGDNPIRRFDVASHKLVGGWKGHEASSSALAVGPDGLLWSGGWDQRVFAWDAQGHGTAILPDQGAWVTELDGDPAGGLVFGTTGAVVTGWDGRAATPTWTAKVASVEDLSVGGAMVAVGETQKIAFLDRATGKPRPSGLGHGGRVTGIAWTSAGVVSSGSDQRLLRWDVTAKTATDAVIPNLQAVGADGTHLVLLENDALTWGPAGTPAKVEGKYMFDAAVGVSTDGTRLAAVRDDGSIHVFDNSGVDGLQVPPVEVKTSALAFSADHQRLALGDYNGNVRILDALMGNTLGQAHFDGVVFGLAFDPTGTVLLISGDPTAVIAVDPTTGAEIGRLDEGVSADAVAWSPDGKNVAIGRRDGTVGLWSTGR